jgi:Domain of unknown function (DUF4129)
VSWALLAAALAAAPCASATEAMPRATASSVCSLEARAEGGAAADRARLEDIFSRDRFARARQSSAGSFKALVDRLMAWFTSLFESSGAQSFSQVTRFLVLTLAAVLAAIGALRLAGSWSGRARPAADDEPSPTALVLDSPAEHLARARAALGREPREAIREGLLGLLSALEDARLARPDRVRTNRELVGELPVRGADPALVARVEPLMRWYDGAFYSLEPVPPQGAARFVDDVEKLSGELFRSAGK